MLVDIGRQIAPALATPDCAALATVIDGYLDRLAIDEILLPKAEADRKTVLKILVRSICSRKSFIQADAVTWFQITNV